MPTLYSMVNETGNRNRILEMCKFRLWLVHWIDPRSIEHSYACIYCRLIATNEQFDRVSVSCCSDLQNKKGNILQASVDYIKRLKKQQLAVSKLVARQEELEKTNHQLALDVQVSSRHQIAVDFVVVHQRFPSCNHTSLTHSYLIDHTDPQNVLTVINNFLSNTY